jgi:hypothetical protein
MAKDEINRKYTRRGIFVDSETRKEIDDVRNQWFDTKSKLNFGQSGKAAAPAAGGGKVIEMTRSGTRK